MDLAQARVQVDYYSGSLWSHQHVKACVIDQAILLFGGSNIADHYLDWSDVNFFLNCELLVGDQLGDLYDLLKGSKKLVVPQKCGESAGFYAKPSTLHLNLPSTKNKKGAKKALVKMIKGARQTLYIQSWYFYPDLEIVEALSAAAKRGVKTQLIISKKTRFHQSIFSTERRLLS